MILTTGATIFQLGRNINLMGDESNLPILICLLGRFRLLRAGRPIELRNASKTKTLLSALALERNSSVPRETLLQLLWPDADQYLAGQSLNSLIHNLRHLLRDDLNDEPPVLYTDGYYQLNVAAGVAVDVAWFELLFDAGQQRERAGDPVAAVESYDRAIQLYRGDLCLDNDMQVLMTRESLRSHYLTLLARLADYHFDSGDYLTCLDYAQRLLLVDSCREDAHRMVMRCCVRQGERAQALRQYQVCELILHTEFDATPEPATTALYNQIRLTPDSV